MRRRAALAVLLAPLVVRRTGGTTLLAQTASAATDVPEIERRAGGRLGVAALDLSTGRRLEYRASERFPMCSTFKWLLGAQVLARVDGGREQLTRVIPYGERDLLEYAPITRARVSDGGMTVSDLVAAAIQYSDNTAANLLLASVGGPSSLTAYVRAVGDPVTRLDRNESDLNSATPGDPRDTTTPGAMVENLRTLLLGAHLSQRSRDRLVEWLVGNTTGAAKLRAGLPPSWRVGDKTGMGGRGSTNDVAVAWPVAGGAPVLMAVYLTGSDASEDQRNAALARVGGVIASWASRH